MGGAVFHHHMKFPGEIPLPLHHRLIFTDRMEGHVFQTFLCLKQVDNLLNLSPFIAAVRELRVAEIEKFHIGHIFCFEIDHPLKGFEMVNSGHGFFRFRWLWRGRYFCLQRCFCSWDIGLRYGPAALTACC